MPRRTTAFDKVMEFALSDAIEGGFANDPDDPGGPTNRGVTLKAAQEAGLDVDGDGDVDIDDIKSMDIDTARIFYKHKYWDAINANSLDWDLAIVACDAAINCGPGNARVWIKKARADSNPVRAFNELRRIYYSYIISRNPTLAKYRNGWNNRVNSLTKFIEDLRAQVASGDLVVEDW